MNYQRVLPRDLFNESKLLKCLGKISLLILDRFIGLRFEHHDANQGFHVCQNEDGDLYCDNLRFYLPGHRQVYFYSLYNCKSPWPLICIDDDEGVIEVFDDNGELSNDFKQFLEKKYG